MQLDNLKKEHALCPSHEELNALRRKFEPWKDKCGVGILLERGPRGHCQVAQLLPDKAAELCGIIQEFDMLYKGALISSAYFTHCVHALSWGMLLGVLILVLRSVYAQLMTPLSTDGETPLSKLAKLSDFYPQSCISREMFGHSIPRGVLIACVRAIECVCSSTRAYSVYLYITSARAF